MILVGFADGATLPRARKCGMVSAGAKPPSHPFLLPVTFHDGTRAVAYELSTAGMHARTTTPLRVGQALSFCVRPQGWRVQFRVHGIVVGARRQGPLVDVQLRFLQMQLCATP